MKEIIVKTQKELDAIKSDFDGTVYIEGGTWDNRLELSLAFEEARIVVRGEAWVRLRGSSHAELRGSSHAVLRESSHAELRGSSHAELWGSSHAVLRESSHAVLRESSHAVLRESSHAVLRESSHAVLRESSHAELRESSHAVLRESSHAELRESSHAELWESSHAELRESSHAVLRESSHAELWGSSHAVLRGSSHAVLFGEAMVSAVSAKEIVCKGYNVISVTKSNRKNIKIVVNKDSYLKIVPDFEPTFDEFAKRYPVEVKGRIFKKAILYKAVHKIDGKYLSDYKRDFEYKIGETIIHEIDSSIEDSCAVGLHVSCLSWAKSFGIGWSDMAILECEVPVNKIVVAKDCDGKVRTSELTVIREVTK